MPAGRPTDYDPSYCEKLIAHMTMGLSFESFAATINTHRATLYDWVQKFPEFDDAKKKGIEKSLLWHEAHGNKSIAGGNKNFNSTAWIFAMKNKFRWADRVVHEGDEDKPIQLAYDPTKLRRRIE